MRTAQKHTHITWKHKYNDHICLYLHLFPYTNTCTYKINSEYLSLFFLFDESPRTFTVNIKYRINLMMMTNGLKNTQKLEYFKENDWFLFDSCFFVSDHSNIRRFLLEKYVCSMTQFSLKCSFEMLFFFVRVHVFRN